MKKVSIVLFLFMAITGFSQTEECDYKIQVDTEDEKFLLTNASLAEFMVGSDKTIFIYFSLMKEGDVKSLVLEVSVNAKEMPPVLCFNKDSRISFQLEDGSFASLRYLGEVNCGRQTNNEDTLDNSTSEAAFYLDETNLERLSEAKISSMRITTMKTNFDIGFQEVISNPQIDTPIYPKEFFLNNLQCLE